MEKTSPQKLSQAARLGHLQSQKRGKDSPPEFSQAVRLGRAKGSARRGEKSYNFSFGKQRGTGAKVLDIVAKEGVFEDSAQDIVCKKVTNSVKKQAKKLGY